MRLHYKLRKNRLFNEYIGSYTSYGIYLKGEDVCYKDISTSKKEAKAIVRVLNREQVSKYHLPEIIDMLLERFQEV